LQSTAADRILCRRTEAAGSFKSNLQHVNKLLRHLCINSVQNTFNLNAISSMHLHRIKSFPLSFERPKESLAKKSRPLPYNCLKTVRNGCKNLTPRPTEERCRASSNRNSCYAIAHNFFNGNYTKAGCFFRIEKI